MPLPPVCDRSSEGAEIIAPDIGLSFKTSPCGKLPFRFGRQSLPCPGRVLSCVFPRNLCNRLIRIGRAGCAVWMTPISAVLTLPFARRNIEYARPSESFRGGSIASGGHEPREFLDGYIMLIDPKRFQFDLVCGRLVRHSVCRSHTKSAAFQQHHSVVFGFELI